MILEISSVIAMIVYLMIAWALERVVYVLFYRPRARERQSDVCCRPHQPTSRVSHQFNDCHRANVDWSTLNVSQVICHLVI